MSLDKQVVYSAALDFNNKQNSLHLTIQPLELEQSYRLGRRWGAERFLELLIPSPDSSNLPALIKKHGSNSFFDELIRHLQTGHGFCGRSWKAFCAKSGGSRKPIKDLQFGPDPGMFTRNASISSPKRRQVTVALVILFPCHKFCIGLSICGRTSRNLF